MATSEDPQRHTLEIDQTPISVIGDGQSADITAVPFGFPAFVAF